MSHIGTVPAEITFLYKAIIPIIIRRPGMGRAMWMDNQLRVAAGHEAGPEARRQH